MAKKGNQQGRRSCDELNLTMATYNPVFTSAGC